MSTSAALYTSDTLRASNAPSFKILEGQLDLGLLQSLQDMNFEFMTPVQAKVMTGLPSMRSDCLVRAKTGTGKTIAFLLPAIQNVIQNSPPNGKVAVLILSPTRELALQIAAEAERLVVKLKKPVEVHTAFGGTAKASTLAKFKRGNPKILVATPGRLNDYLSELDVRNQFNRMQTLILDEADRMLDQGFLPDILRVLQALPPKRGPDGGWQGMCFSATIPPRMQQVLSHVLAEDHVSISTLDAAEPPTLAKVPQYSVIIPDVEDTLTNLFALLKLEINTTEGQPKIIVFGTTANLVALYAKTFECLLNLPIFQLHSRLSQPSRTRATDQFKTAKNGVMFASDVIGRGMDFPDVSLVLQVGVPLDSDAYTHRVGRTARAGKDGRAVILLTKMESFYIRDNRQFPIKPYPASADVLSTAESLSSMMTDTLKNIDSDVKRKAYSSYMGFMKGFCKKMHIDPPTLVKMCNRFALEGMFSGDIPTMDKSTIGKMGLKGVPGIHFAAKSTSSAASGRGVGSETGGGRAPASRSGNFSASGPIKRPRHQGLPDELSIREFNSDALESTRTELSINNPSRGGRGGSRGGGRGGGRGSERGGRGRGN